MKRRYLFLICFLAWILGFSILALTSPVRVKAFSYEGEIPTPIAQIVKAANFSLSLQNFSSVFIMDNKTYDVYLEYADVVIVAYETLSFIDLQIRNLSIRGDVNLAFSKMDLYLIIIYGQEGGDFLLTAYTEIPLWEFIVGQKLTQKVKKIGGMI